MMSWKLAVVAVGVIAGIVLLLVLAGETGESMLNSRGRIELPVHADYVPVDEKGRPAPGTGGGLERVCEVDALVVVTDGRISEVKQKGANRVDVGEQLTSAAAGYTGVYRDKQGKLREGCDPESWQLHPDVPAEQ